MYSEDFERVTLTGDGSDGFPAEVEFIEQMEDYLQGLNPKKRAKALMTQDMYSTILAVLLEPHSTSYSTAQFRFWSKRMFRLVSTEQANIVTHENRPVAVRDQIYSILVGCHGDASHGGRDKTSAQVRRYYSWIPKELVSRFVKMCPHCTAKRKAQRPFLHDPLPFSTSYRNGDQYPDLMAPVPLPASDLAFINQDASNGDYEVSAPRAQAYDGPFEYQIYQPFAEGTLGNSNNFSLLSPEELYLPHQHLFPSTQPSLYTAADLPSPNDSPLSMEEYDSLPIIVPSEESQYTDGHYQRGVKGSQEQWSLLEPKYNDTLEGDYTGATFALPPQISYPQSFGTLGWEFADEPSARYEAHQLERPEDEHFSEDLYVQPSQMPQDGMHTRRTAKPPPLDLGRSSNLFPVATETEAVRPSTGIPLHLNEPFVQHQGCHSAPLYNSHFSLHRGGDALLPSPGPLSACSSSSLASTSSYNSVDSYASNSSFTSDCNSLTSAFGSFPLTPNASHSGELSSWQQSGKELAEAIQTLFDTAVTAEPPLLLNRDADTIRRERERTRTRTISSGTPQPTPYSVGRPPQSAERRRATMYPFALKERSETTPKKDECRYSPY